MGATERGVELAPLTTMRVGGPADTLVTAETLDEVVAAVRARRSLDELDGFAKDLVARSQ
mgnify:CR=1 FL=1